MQDRLAELESRLAAVEQRLRALENPSSVETGHDGAAPAPAFGDAFISNASTHIGRVLLIFGGAYLLRAITAIEFVPAGVGILMGASYALLWLFMAYRQGGVEDQRTGAMFLGGTSVLLALPLLSEAISRFHLLSGQQGVLGVAIYCALGLAVAGTRNLRSLGGLVTAGGIATAFAVLIIAHSALAVSVFLLLLGLGSLWVAYWRQWLGLQWLGALGANAGVLTLAILRGSAKWSLEPGTVALLGTALLLAYLLSFVIRSHLRGEVLSFFEAAQTLFVSGIAFWAAVAAARADQLSLLPVGTVIVALGGCAYSLAFTPKTRSVHGRNFFYYSSVGLIFVITGSSLILPPVAAAAIWSGLALMLAYLSGRSGWVNLSLQCSILLMAAGWISGILTTGLHALVGSAAAWPASVALHIGVALTTVICLFVPVAQRSKGWGRLAGVPQLIALALSVWEVGGLIVVHLAPILAGVGGAEPNLAALAALRTSVLASASVILALSSRFRRWPEARSLVYPVLVVVAIKLFLEDFPHGKPASLFVALAFVGSSLLIVAKLLKRDETAS